MTALGLGLQMPSFYEQIFGNQLGVSYNEALTNLTVDDNQNSLEPIDNQSLTIQSQKLNELEQNLLNLGVPTNEICNISDRKTLFKYHPDKALINRLSEAKANEIFQNLSVYRSQLENFTDDGALNLLENSTNHQPDNLLNESQINFSPKGNQTETQQNSIPLNPNNLIKISLGGITLIVSQEAARKLWAKYREKQQERESQTREKAAVKIQSIARMHQAKQEKERLAREVAERARQNEYVPNYNFSPNPTENPNQTETSQNQPNS